MAAGSAWTSGAAGGVCLKELHGAALAESVGAADISVVFHLSGTTTATAGGNVFLVRVLEGFVEGFAQSTESIRPTYKGWEWDTGKPAPAPEWETETEGCEDWVEITRNAAEWAAQGVAAQGWTRIHGGAAQWR